MSRICPTCGQNIDLNALPFGVRLRMLREDKGWTARQAAAACGLPQTTYSSMEARHEWPTESAVRKLATGLEVDILTLLGVERDDEKNDS